MKLFLPIFLFLITHQLVLSQKISIDISNNGVCFKEGSDSILFYQTANKDINGKYSSCNYIHPLYSLDGQVLTEDFPADHPHQRGIFWAWHQLYVGEQRIGDGWEIKDIHWEVVSVKEQPGKNNKSIIAGIIWKSPLFTDHGGNELPLVKENTTISVWPRKANYRKIEIKISLLAQQPDMRLGGSENEKGYGGFSARIRLDDETVFQGANRIITPQNLPLDAGGWVDITGPVGLNGSKAGVTIVNHPDNPGYPNPWILRAKNSMQNVVFPHPGAQAIQFSNKEPIILRYMLIIHDGENLEDIPKSF